MRLLTKGNRRPGRDRSPTMNNVIRQKKPRRDKNDDRRKRLFFCFLVLVEIQVAEALVQFWFFK